MKNNKWNKVRQNTNTFWDPDMDLGYGKEIELIRSDKSIVNNYSGIKFEQGMQVLMRVAAELISKTEEAQNVVLDEWGRGPNPL